MTERICRSSVELEDLRAVVLRTTLLPSVECVATQPMQRAKHSVREGVAPGMTGHSFLLSAFTEDLSFLIL